MEDDRIRSVGGEPKEQAGASPKLFAIGEEGVRNIVSGLSGGGDGGSGGGDLGARMAKVEASVQNIEGKMSSIEAELRILRSDARGDFRLLFGALITAVIGLAGLMAHGFHWF